MPADKRDIHDRLYREQVREEIQQEMAAKSAAEEDKDKRLIALLVFSLLFASFAIPALAVVTGVACRAFSWAAGY